MTDERNRGARTLTEPVAAAPMWRRTPAREPGPGPQATRIGYFGVEGLDDLLPQGITYDSQIMSEGDTGVGKSVLAAQFLYEGLVTGDTCVYVACDEPPQVMRVNMANFRLGTMAHEQAGRLIFVDAYARERSRERFAIPEPENFDEFFLHTKKVIELAGDRPVRMVTDSLSTIMATARPDDILAFNSNRLRYLRSRNVLALDAYVGGILDERTMNGLRHAYPMIVYLKYITSNGFMQRYIQLGKLKSGQFQASQHTFSIDPRTGIIVHPQRT